MDVSFDILGGLFFHLTRRQIFQCAMRSFGIVKLNIGSYTGLKCSIGRMVLAVELFFFNDAKNDSATALSCGLPSGEKDCFVLCSYRICWKRWKVYCAPRSLWKIRSDGGWRSSCAILNVAVISCVLFLFEILCAITLCEKRSMITQI